MALEDLTGTNKYISNLNASWPVDDDWVDEGDNHIRGVKNVLKNTFPDTNGVVRWSASWARFPDGTQSVPGISWVNEVSSGFTRTGTSTFAASVGGQVAFTWNTQQVSILAPWTFHTFAQPIVHVGFSGAVADSLLASLRVDGDTQAAGLCLHTLGVASWVMAARPSDGNLWFSTNSATGPAGLGNYSATIRKDGQVLARSFTPIASVMADVQPLTGALAEVLKLRGVRFVDAETGRASMGVAVEDVERAFPQLVSGTGVQGAGKAVDVMALAAPLVEAIRELHARVAALEARVANA